MPNYTGMNDDDLVILTQKGDMTAFDTLHKRHRPKVKSYCKRILGNEEEAEDATQETFVRVYGGIMTGRYKPGSFRTGNFRAWLYRIARNICIDCIRKRKNNVPLDGIADVLPAPVLDAEVPYCVKLALEKLTDEDWFLLERKGMGFTYKEISVMMGWTLNHAYQRVIEAKERFRIEFERVCPEVAESQLEGWSGEKQGRNKKEGSDSIPEDGDDSTTGGE